MDSVEVPVDPTRTRASSGGRRGPLRWMRSTSARLLIIALVPTIGLAGFARNETFGRRAEARAAERLQRDVRELSEIIALRFEVSFDEIPTLAMTFGPQLGIPVSQVSTILGVDLEQVLLESSARLERTIAAHPDEPLFQAVGAGMAALRARPEPGDADTDVYAAFSAMLDPLDRAAADLASQILGGLDGADVGVRDAVSQLVTVHALSRLAGQQLMAYFDTQLPQMGFGSGRPLDSLAAVTGVYAKVAGDLGLIEQGATAVAWNQFTSDTDVVAFERAIDVALAGEAPSLLDDLDYTATVVRSGLARHRGFEPLVADAGDDVIAAAAQLRSDALARLTDALLVLVVVAAISIVIVSCVARSITRPLQRLSRYASAVSGGDVHAGRSRGRPGPVEVRTVADAFDDVIDNLRAIDAHAFALAAGRLDDPVLAQPLPGQLGRSLQASVEHLQQSIADRDELQRRLAHEATHDGLTGVPNRSAAMFALESAIARNKRRGTALAVLLIDLDDFKRANDTLGQGAGDEILRETSKRLRDLARTDDTVARLGGDEFVLIAEAIGSIHDAVAIAERTIEAIGRPISIRDRAVEVGASVGIAISLDGFTSGDTLVREADLAVYRAKEAGPRRIEVFDTAMRAEVTERSEMEDRLAEALRLDQLTVAYQPVVSTSGLYVQGFEALVRWKDADGRPIPPDAFIPIAEASDLIVELDRWVIRHATAELATWSELGLPDDIHLAVNVSGRHLVDRRIVDDVSDALRDSGLCPTRLVLEITETVLLSDLPVACAHLEQLRGLGCTIALDDFGSGYTSLATLRQLPVDVLKIDRSLVAELAPDRGQSLVRLIIEAAHEFGMGVIAEGVETDEQRGLLEALGCEQVQGWLVSPAVPAEQARALALNLSH